MSGPLDILLVNACILDGTGAPAIKASVGIKNNIIAFIGDDRPSASDIINVEGLVLCPGFIDTHGHSEFSVLAAPECMSKLYQGITTEINGNCGLSAAPLAGEAKERREADLDEFNITERWSTFDEYFEILRKRSPFINFATLTGHGNIRASVKGYSDGRSTKDEVIEMSGMLNDTILKGSLGLSTGLIYPPGVFTDREELVALIKGIRSAKDLVYATHMRSEGDLLIESIEEVISICRSSGIKAHISHLKTGGRDNWHKVYEAISSVDKAINEGLDITFDRYPYTGAATDLDIMLPSWAYEGGNERELERISDKASRKKIIDHIRSIYKDENEYGSVIISSVTNDKNRWMEGEDLLSISGRVKKSPWDAVLDLLVEENLRVGAIYMSMSEDNLRKFLSHPKCMIGSDSAVRNYSGITAKGKPHPRGFGSMPRFLGKYVRDEALMGLEEGIRRITSFPAETFGLAGRGMIKEGYYADITVFDQKTVIDKATYKEPFSRPEGIHHVIINGKISVFDGELIPDSGHGIIIKAK
ncbi:MAG: D-aminoacylase [Nitrospirota bacterium]|nr:MAG: D-aminoacylase [Nitrospirota bacterium]